jgi:hypothetical protein
MADQTSPRRRFQFRLRMLMIVVTLLAVACGYVGWQAKVVRQRAEVLNWLQERGPLKHVVYGTPGYDTEQDVHRRWSVAINDPDLPWLRRLLGDHWIMTIIHPTAAVDDEIERVRKAFPEAQLIPWKTIGTASY